MDGGMSVEVSENGKVFGGRKYHPIALKDVKRKLSFLNKRINDLHHQRRFAYKNSAKVKKMVHNQVNQIVKCLRARERNLWSEVDEAYICQDANISDELSKLQSAHARCKVLVNHLDDFKGNRNIFSKIHSILAEVNFESSETKPLEFISEFEAMKTSANNYGHLEGDFFKKDDFALDAEKNASGSFLFTQLLDKEKCSKETMSELHTNDTTSINCLDKFSSSGEEPDVEDSFQIIDLLDNMHCHDANEDYIMCEEEIQNCDLQTENFNGTSDCEIKNNSTEVCESAKNSYEVSKNKISFNPEEEWKQVLEMNKKIEDFKDMLKSQEDKKMNYKVYNGISEHRETNENLNDFKPKFLFLKKADNWLHNPSSWKEKKLENISFEANLTSPAELIQKAFKPYLIKDDVKNWLSCE